MASSGQNSLTHCTDNLGVHHCSDSRTHSCDTERERRQAIEIDLLKFKMQICRKTCHLWEFPLFRVQCKPNSYKLRFWCLSRCVPVLPSTNNQFHLTSLGFCFFICKIGMMVILATQDLEMTEEVIHVEYIRDLASSLAQSGYLINIVISISAQMCGAWSSAVLLTYFGFSTSQANKIKDAQLVTNFR